MRYHKRLFICFLLFLPLADMAQDVIKKPDRPKIALVLSGGGAKGFAHIGVLKVLEEEGIPIDLIVGTSMGSLVGGIYSIGYSSSELEGMVKSLDWEAVLSDEVPRAFLSKNDQLLKQRYIFSLPITGEKKLSLPQGLIKGQNVLNIFCGLAGNVPANADFEKFPIPFACVSADLETGKEVVLKNGFLPTAMFSSMAIPIAFQSSNREGRLLVDGGIVNNFPTDVAKKMGADIIIGVDIRKDYYNRNNLKSLDSVLGQLINFFDQAKDSVNNSLCNMIIRPDISGYSMYSFNKDAVDTLILRGEMAAGNFREQLRELKIKYDLKPHPISREMIKPDQWHIIDLQFSGNEHLDVDFLRKNLKMKIPGNYSPEDIKIAIDQLYGLGAFEQIYYNLFNSERGKILNLNVVSKRHFTQNIGFKANTTDAAAVLINTTQKNYGKIISLFSTSAELSVNPGLILMAESNKTNFPTVGINLSGKYQHFGVFENGSKIFKANIFYASGGVYMYQPFFNRFNLGVGLQEEYFQDDLFVKNINYAVTSYNKSHFLTNMYSYLSFDNMDDFYFPRKGTNLLAESSFLTDFHNVDKFCPVLLFKMRNVIPVGQYTSLLLDLYGRALFNANFPEFKMTLIGGESYSQYFNYHLPFVGLSAFNMAERFAYIGLIGFRVKVTNSQYFSLVFNGLWQTSDMGLGNKMLFGGGIKYGLKTLLGPLDMTLGYSGSTDKPTFSANFGYWF